MNDNVSKLKTELYKGFNEFKALVTVISNGKQFHGTTVIVPEETEILAGCDLTDMIIVGNIFANDGKSLIIGLNHVMIQPMETINPSAEIEGVVICQ